MAAGGWTLRGATAGTPASAQRKGFEDTWRWDEPANHALTDTHTDPAVPAPLAAGIYAGRRCVLVPLLLG
ncbi:MAG: hypothetical protein ACOC8F_00460 [Planctomycetota bacterium]